jgi:predicted nucleotidyltransferase
MKGKVIEGNFLETGDGDIFEVRGLVHPSDGYIAYARYIRSKCGNRKSKDGHTYRKLSTLSEKMSYAQKKTPFYLQFDTAKDRVIQIVPKSDVVRILNPIEHLRKLVELGAESKFERDVVDFSTNLSTRTGVRLENMGIIGSHLAGLALSSSDIDFIVYGCDNGRKFYSKLGEILSQHDEFERYSGKGLVEHTQLRWGRTNNIAALEILEEQKVLQGRFRSRDFFIRLVPDESDVRHEYGDHVTRSSGLVYRTCKIVDDCKAIFTPCEYSVQCDDDPFLTRIVGYQSRFAEVASEGMTVRVFGKLESVISRIYGFHRQIVLGGNASSSLLPISA